MKRRHLLFGFFWLLLAIGIAVILVLAFPHPRPTPISYGVTFSKPHAEGLGLDWTAAYDATLNELGVKQLRLVAYWNEIESEEGVLDFAALDYQMDQAASHDAAVVLAVGRKVPRWPECHIPVWAQQLAPGRQRAAALAFVQAVVSRYREHPALRMWQLENEPFLEFGECTDEHGQLLTQEEMLLERLDQDRPVMITDSGELNSWIKAAQHGDVVGTTMYRTVHSQRTERLFSYDYIFPSWMYRLKSRYIYLLFGKNVVISELQGEPWGAVPFQHMTPAERMESFSPARFKELAHFARRTQLPVAYWWGVEYWYWEKEMHGVEGYWEFARNLL